ncbi:MAG TPA: 30S ribosomal protein S8, partial [Nautiliaceae bacterium]|nr:30S ribosomal protein S8 [Nautiliaceae bacterium]
MNNDPLANALSKINNAEKANKKEVVIAPISNLIIKVLEIMKEKSYIEDFEVKEKDRKRYAIVKLSHNLNKCGAIKPRFFVSKDNYEKYEKRYLPAVNFGYLVVSTSKGVMTNEEAKDKRIGG